MKLRLRGGSLRLRVTRGEVARLAAGDAVAEVVPFGATALSYALRVADVPAVDASFEGGRIEVRVPAALAGPWLASEQVGLAASQGSTGAALHILIEKDFACLKPRAGEDDGDAYPHPLAPGKAG